MKRRQEEERAPTSTRRGRDEEAESSLLLGFTEWDFETKWGSPLHPPAWDLALGAWIRPEPHPHPHTFTQLEAAKPLSPKPSLSPPPSAAQALLLYAPSPASCPHFPLWASLRLMHPDPPADAPPPPPLALSRSPPTPGASPTAPTSFPVPPVAPGYSRFGHSKAARLDSPCGAEVEAREGCPGAGAAAAPAAVMSRGGSHPAGSSGRISAPHQPPLRHRPAPGRPQPPGSCSIYPCSSPGLSGAARRFQQYAEQRFYSSPGLCQSVAMFPPASHLLSLLLVIDAGGTVPSPQGVPQGCYAAEEAGEQTFRCSQAGLSTVPTSIPNDTRKLYLDANRLASVPAGAFRHLPVLEELDLSHNILAHLSGAAFQGLAGTLRHLDLSANQLASVPVEAFMGLKIQVNLSANPWRCDCALQEVLRRVRLAPGTGAGIVCGPEARPDLVGQKFLPLVGEEELCGTGRGGARRSTDVALLVTMGGWLVLVVAYLAHYVWQNRDETRRPLKRAQVLPVRSEDSSTLSTMV
ncbi:leucine-rich repeat-containing protein 3C [Budorcas taxicolor]|uniref:leucine-rich repeat-containing protein 3C n=1 Tax=Budorcas taxicolor TaxID=37181 RepID=UPI002284DA99|nr:leucine-rich repeat-containing protein 3C [Budorcas taxicolor]